MPSSILSRNLGLSQLSRASKASSSSVSYREMYPLSRRDLRMFMGSASHRRMASSRTHHPGARRRDVPVATEACCSGPRCDDHSFVVPIHRYKEPLCQWRSGVRTPSLTRKWTRRELYRCFVPGQKSPSSAMSWLLWSPPPMSFVSVPIRIVSLCRPVRQPWCKEVV